MKKVMISPSKYVQGANEIENLEEHVLDFGKKALVVISEEDFGRFKTSIEKNLESKKIEFVYTNFVGKCTRKEIERIKEIGKENNTDIVIGIGGGTALDTAKVVANDMKKAVIIAPTIASTDAPCTALTVVYTENGEFEEYIFFKKNPDIVLVDTKIISQAPVRFLIAGMGDALATYFEARAAVRADGISLCGAKITKAAFALATLCYETLKEDGLKAKKSAEAKVLTKALDNVIEANILLSGLGAESAGLAAAHSIHNGLTLLEETHNYYHGEKVAFGTIVQLVLENAPMEEIQEVINFCKKVGLPTSLKDLGIEKIDPEKIMEVAKLSLVEGETIHNMPFEINADLVYGAILSADLIGQ